MKNPITRKYERTEDVHVGAVLVYANDSHVLGFESDVAAHPVDYDSLHHLFQVGTLMIVDGGEFRAIGMSDATTTDGVKYGIVHTISEDENGVLVWNSYYSSEYKA